MCTSPKIYSSFLVLLITCQYVYAASKSITDDQKEQLFQACALDDIHAITALAQQGVDMNYTDDVGWTPLHHAAAAGNAAMLRTLTQHGAHADALVSGTLATALHLSTIAGQFDITRILLEEYQLDPTVGDDEDLTPLHCAASLGYEQFIRLFMQHFPRAANIRDICDRTPLHYAAETGKTNVVRAFIREYKADSDARDNKGLTPMHYAAIVEKDYTANYLFSHHPDLIQIRDDKHKTPLMHVVENSYMASFLLGKISSRANVLVSIPSVLMPSFRQTDNHCLICAMHPSLDYATTTDLAALCCARCSKNIVHHPQRTPLHVLAALGHRTLTQLTLAEHPEYSTTPDENGMLPLHWAAHANQPEATALLLEHAPQTLHVNDNNYNTPLMYASVHEPTETLNTILNAMNAEAHILLQEPEVVARLTGPCALCTQTPEDPTTLSCCVSAAYCTRCIQTKIEGQYPFCPMCEEGLYTTMLMKIPVPHRA